MPKETAGHGGLRIKDVVMQLLRRVGALGTRILTSLNPLTWYSLPLPISLWIIATLSARLHQGGEMHSGFYHRKTIHPEPFSGDTPIPQNAQSAQRAASSYSVLFPGSLPTSVGSFCCFWIVETSVQSGGQRALLRELEVAPWLRRLALLRALEFLLEYPGSSQPPVTLALRDMISILASRGAHIFV